MFPPIRVLFLDFDGVLNHEQWLLNCRRPHPLWEELDPSKVALVNDVIAATTAMVVISSAWRSLGMGRCQEILETNGFHGHILGVTPYVDGPRGDEISHWLNQWHQERPRRSVERYVVLDDDTDTGGVIHGERWIRTDPKIGLTPEHAQRAIALLLGRGT